MLRAWQGSISGGGGALHDQHSEPPGGAIRGLFGAHERMAVLAVF